MICISFFIFPKSNYAALMKVIEISVTAYRSNLICTASFVHISFHKLCGKGYGGVRAVVLTQLWRPVVKSFRRNKRKMEKFFQARKKHADAAKQLFWNRSKLMVIPYASFSWNKNEILKKVRRKKVWKGHNRKDKKLKLEKNKTKITKMT